MNVDRIRILIFAGNLLVAAFCGALVFAISIFTLGTFHTLEFGCLYYCGLTMVAASGSARCECIVVALIVPFVLVPWADAVYDGILILIAFRLSQLASRILLPQLCSHVRKDTAKWWG